MAGILRTGPRKLWTPGQVKPEGIPRINWRHPLAHRLVSYWWGFDASYIDLVTGDTTKKGIGTKNVLPAGRPTRYGTGPAFPLGTQLCESINFGPATWAFPFTYAVGWYQIGASVTSAGGYFGLWDNANTQPWALYANANNTCTFSVGASAGPAAETVSQGAFHVAVGTATGTTSQVNWLDGLVKTAGVNTSGSTVASARYVFCGFQADDSSLDVINAVIFFGAAWAGRALSGSEAIQLYNDPYCFLVPQEPEMMIIQVGGPTITKPIGTPMILV